MTGFIGKTLKKIIYKIKIMKTLRLPLKKKWFEMTKAGIKTEEYRNINEYWFIRLIADPYHITINGYSYLGNGLIELLKNGIKADNIVFKHFDTTTLTLGYPSNSDKECIIEFEQLSISIGYGKEEWGAEPNKLYFVIKHGKRLNQ